MILIQEVIYESLNDLDVLLDGVDADFTGTNGEEYFTEEGISHLEKALNIASERGYNLERTLDFVLESCKEYSINYYDDFKYIVEPIYDNACMVTIAACNR